MKVSAVIVTYNRLELLKECLETVSQQSAPLHRIVVIDNASDDGTGAFLKQFSDNSSYHVVTCEKNLGGAGGFALGLKTAVLDGADYVWIMDDDTIPERDALLNLTKHVGGNLGFVCSSVKWVDGSDHLMNKPGGVRFNNLKGLYECECCSFVSVLIASKAIKKVGLPYKEFFIWCDDLEYTLRLYKAGYNCIYEPQSIVVHKSKTNYFPSVDIAPIEMANRFYYQARNSWFLKKKYAKNKIILFASFLNKLRKARHRINKRPKEEREIFWQYYKKGLLDGIRFNPKVEFI